MNKTSYTEDCCFNYHQDNCKGRGCSCACHMEVAVSPACGHEAELERYRQRSRDEDTARIRLNHERVKYRDALELIARGVWTAPNSIETIVYTARQALKG